MFESGIWNIDEQLRVLGLVQTQFEGNDLVMLVDNNGTPVEGDGVRPFPDGKPRMTITGYSWGLTVNVPGGAASDRRRTMNPLTVVRRTDAATASLASLVSQAASNLRVLISAFRAGGDPSVTDTQPMFEIELSEARISGQFLLSGGPLGTLSEILVLDYRGITLRSAAQQSTGARSAVRECSIQLGTR